MDFLNSVKKALAGPTATAVAAATSVTLPSDGISRKHWVPDALVSACADCQRPFGPALLRQHCRKCGRIFCATHVVLTLRLLPDTTPDPRGTPVRVCTACYTAQPSWQQQEPVTRSHTGPFISLRSEIVQSRNISATRVISALERLHETVKRVKLKQAEQCVVEWASDKSALLCHSCVRPFTLVQRRKHHCRTCGSVCCADCAPVRVRQLGTIESVPSEILSESDFTGKLPSRTETVVIGSDAISTRICVDCDEVLSWRNIVWEREKRKAKGGTDESASESVKQLSRMYERLRRMKEQLDELLFRFAPREDETESSGGGGGGGGGGDRNAKKGSEMAEELVSASGFVAFGAEYFEAEAKKVEREERAYRMEMERKRNAETTEIETQMEEYRTLSQLMTKKCPVSASKTEIKIRRNITLAVTFFLQEHKMTLLKAKSLK